MTEPSRQTSRAPRDGAASRPRRPGPAMVVWGSIALFAVLFALLTYQLGTGNDPLLGGAAASRPVLVRKVVKRRVITTVLPGPGSSSVSSGPVTTSSAGVIASGAPIVTGAS